jgi:glycerol-3-phosphate dehydrogenase (NAD(P)+)
MRIAVLGAGAWGTALALTFLRHHSVALWARDPTKLGELAQTRTNQRYLPGFPLPAELELQPELGRAIGSAELILVAVPSSGLRQTLTRVKQARVSMPLVWACKGFETGSAKLPTEVAQEELGKGYPCGVLSGPSFAEEVARGLPAAVTLASRDGDFAQATAKRLHDARFRVYSSDDEVGIEVAGAVKNVMAIATGICDGLGLGLNARAALITRGLAEVARLALQLGGRMETVMGLGGMGDLILTCTGDLSRNRRVGLELASGHALSSILNDLGHVAEGVASAAEVRRLAARFNVDMPISEAVCRILYDGVPPKLAVEQLLSREPKAEV